MRRMKALLSDEYESFISALDKPAVKGARINTLKCDPDTLYKSARHSEGGRGAAKTSLIAISPFQIR